MGRMECLPESIESRVLCQLVCRPILEQFAGISYPAVRYWDGPVPGADAIGAQAGHDIDHGREEFE
jgi:hypothetical protein